MVMFEYITVNTIQYNNSGSTTYEGDVYRYIAFVKLHIGCCLEQMGDQSCVDLGCVFWLWWCGLSGGGEWTEGLEKGICGEVSDRDFLCRWHLGLCIYNTL